MQVISGRYILISLLTISLLLVITQARSIKDNKEKQPKKAARPSESQSEDVVVQQAQPVENKKEKQQKKSARPLESQSKDVRVQLTKTSQQYWKAVKSHLKLAPAGTKQKRSSPVAVLQNYYKENMNMTSLPPITEVFSTKNVSIDVELVKTLKASLQVNHTLSQVSQFWMPELTSKCVYDKKHPASLCHMKCHQQSQRKAELNLICRLETKDLPRLANLIHLLQNEITNKNKIECTECVDIDSPPNMFDLRSVSIVAISYANLQVTAIESGLKQYSSVQAKSKAKRKSS